MDNLAVVAAKYQGNHQIWLRFNNGEEGVADFSGENWGEGMGSHLAHEEFFRYFAIDNGVLVWVNGYDMCSDFVHSKLRVEH